MVFNATWYFLIKEDYYQLGNWYSTMFVIKDKRICVGVFICCLCMYSRWRSSCQEGRIGATFTGLTPPHIVPVPIQDLGFQRGMLWSVCCCVQWVQLWWTRNVRFVDIDGIDHHLCLNFLFIANCLILDGKYNNPSGMCCHDYSDWKLQTF